MSRPRRALLGLLVGAAGIVAGSYLLFGLGWALIVAGALVSAYFLLLFDVEAGEEGS